MSRVRVLAGSVLIGALMFGVVELAVRAAIRFDLWKFRDPAHYAHPFCNDDYHRLRILWLDKDAGEVLPGFAPDSLLGWAPVPRPGTRSGSAPPAGRLALFGDSFLAGVPPCGPEDRIPALLAAALPEWEVIDRAAPGYGPDQMYLSLVELVQDPATRPDVCIVGLLLDDMDRVIEEFRDAPKPHFELDEAGLLLQGVPVPSTEEALRREPPHIPSYLVALLRTKWTVWGDHGAPWESRCRASEKVLLSRSLLEHMVRVCDLYGTTIRFLIFYPQPDLAARTWREQQLQAMLTSLGRPVVDTRRSLTGRDASELYFAPPNQHPNDIANRLVAAQILEEMGLAPRAADPMAISFGAQGNSLRFVREGWHVAQEEYTFTSKTRSSLEVQGEPGRAYHARLRLGQVVARPGDRRVLTISAGGAMVGRWPMDSLLAKGTDQTLEFDVRAEATGRIRVTLDLPWLLRVADIGVRNDARSMGVAVRSLELEPA